ncbi:hypothetical protein SISNIDRAFT_453563 [Sistotremastrum niveocremeum HHB9708]|uniref:MYND-type domain-containing protein n=2 Tax=Sistotremastraceae TaxID=3402574 RepID=A0A164VZG9_9AGAM|nr:hypothetical protein SISNIDRAFT_453563 [Sistotremastrum niveocremeum HHB9708]KZT34233.1 hypothetical protein SISSUDRAFT_1053104 [Sistotremastrum suecicum HHB10207 ss-3]
MSANNISYPCDVCHRPTSMWCSRCQRAWYCCEEHLQQAWPQHRKSCTPVNTAPPTISQSVGMYGQQEAFSFCALLLSTNEDRARIIEIKCTPTSSATRQTCPSPLVNSYFPESTPASLILTQGLNQEPLRFPLQVWYCPVSMARASPPNKAIHRITSGQMRKTWCGPVVVLKYSGSRRQTYSDATTHDLGTLSAYFISLS